MAQAGLELAARVRVHLTPGEVNALWHLTRYIGQSFWHLATWVQVTLAGAVEVPSFAWLWRWDPLKPEEKSGRGADADRTERGSGANSRFRNTR